MNSAIPNHWTPWIGRDYPQRRLLVLGESFYQLVDDRGGLWPAAPDQPVKLVTDAYDDASYRYRFNRMIVRALAGKENLEEDDWRTSWDDVAFTNYVTTTVEGRARVRPTNEAWALSAAAWPNLLAALLPRSIVVLGKTLWNNMPFDGYDPVTQSYALGNGGRTSCIAVRHPAAGLSWQALSEAIQEVERRASRGGG